ncbi:hypothetical protein SAMN05443572_11414 [Myxococcus fulvus]|uniref:Uncharacterized protein n=1 Tax=Myxococcus fulvus TaxID=33 RepID=A0A511TAE2_MYXFU|nr:hypothetical protein [Myxococcus fulvus]BDT38647.1 hypothetical protein MFMH1_83160 [Myxococcus sp. MH1]GEN11164.1 hypothetical protein MFU01_62010 [Myxococcus fulvus]SEU39384.1 hypothetical protein SAMN05443572_11414 [Myxococcus fulvus]
MEARRIIDVEVLSKHLTDEHFLQLAKQAPKEAARSITEGPLTSDRWIYRLVVIFLGIIALTSLVGGVVLTGLWPNWAMPQMLVALGSTAVGALAGLLAPPPRDR